MNIESLACWLSAGMQPRGQSACAIVVPWLVPAKPITSSTMGRVSGHHRSAQRGTMPPWLWPAIAMRRPARWNIVRTAYTTYSPLTWMSLLPLDGNVTAHHGMPRALKSGS